MTNNTGGAGRGLKHLLVFRKFYKTISQNMGLINLNISYKPTEKFIISKLSCWRQLVPFITIKLRQKTWNKVSPLKTRIYAKMLGSRMTDNWNWWCRIKMLSHRSVTSKKLNQLYCTFPIEISNITFFSQYNGNDHIYLFQRLTVKSEPNSKNIKIDDFRFFSLHFFTQTSLCLRYKLYGLLTDSLTHFAFCEEQRSYKIRFDLP